MLVMSLPDHIFYGNSLDAALRGSEQKLNEAASAIPADHALARSVEELAAELIEKFHVEPLALNWDAVTASSDDARIDVSGDWGRGLGWSDGPVYVPGTTITYHIPFTGERDLFKFQPSTSSFNPPRGTVGEHELRLVATATAEGRAGLKAALDTEVAKVKQCVEHANSDVTGLNARLEGAARQAAERRREKVLADRELMASLGVPVRRREDAAPTYAVAPVRRQATPVRGHAPKAPEPVLPAEEYEHILDIVRGMVTVMERSPKAFARLDEEALRDHFLVQLNGQYQGGATGETFNFEGKTDILVRVGGRNLFIGECKFWDGAAKLTATVGQLLGYASWRDTKTAILLFNRGRALTRVLSQISPTISVHPNCVREIAYGGETDFRFVLRHRDDPERELTLTVVVFEVPTATPRT